MNKKNAFLKNISISLCILLLSFGICLLIQYYLNAQASIHAIFVLAVFLISLKSDRYIYGIAASVISVIAINYAFTFPYFSLNFSIPENMVSAVIMIIISTLTCTLTLQIKRSEALKTESEKERMRANLLRAVSHDLRTPLTTIYGSGYALLEHSDSMTDERKTKIIRGICEDSQWLLNMVENLLSITRLDSGKVKLNKSSTVVDELMDSVLAKFKKRHPEAEVKLNLPDEFICVEIDSILISQVLINILENSVQHATGMTEIKINIFTKNNYAYFEITDDGCGIPENKLPKLFKEGFDTSEMSPDSHKNNLGIGLSVCASILKAHGGEIYARNINPKGALFGFRLIYEEDNNA